MARKRKVPLRKCVVTKEMKPKNNLIRIVRNKEGEVFVDLTGKQNGRGAYVSNDISIIEKAIEEKVLNEQFKMNVNQKVYDQLKQLSLGKKDE